MPFQWFKSVNSQKKFRAAPQKAFGKAYSAHRPQTATTHFARQPLQHFSSNFGAVQQVTNYYLTSRTSIKPQNFE